MRPRHHRHLLALYAIALQRVGVRRSERVFQQLVVTHRTVESHPRRPLSTASPTAWGKGSGVVRARGCTEDRVARAAGAAATAAAEMGEAATAAAQAGTEEEGCWAVGTVGAAVAAAAKPPTPAG
jgi:hypothetical protein